MKLLIESNNVDLEDYINKLKQSFELTNQLLYNIQSLINIGIDTNLLINIDDNLTQVKHAISDILNSNYKDKYNKPYVYDSYFHYIKQEDNGDIYIKIPQYISSLLDEILKKNKNDFTNIENELKQKHSEIKELYVDAIDLYTNSDDNVDLYDLDQKASSILNDLKLYINNGE